MRSLPHFKEAIADASSRATLLFRRWLEAIDSAVSETSEDLAALATALGSPDGTVENIPAQANADLAGVSINGTGPVSVQGSLASGHVTIGGRTLNDSLTGSLRGITVDTYGRVSGTTDATITGTAGEITVTNGDAVAGPPTLSLADVTDAGGGTLQKTAFDAKGRKTGSSAATTSDLTEGTNLYFTDARAKAAAVADSITDGVTDVAPSQNAVFDALAGKADKAAPSFTGLQDAVDDTAAATAGVPVGGVYRNGSVLMIRVT